MKKNMYLLALMLLFAAVNVAFGQVRTIKGTVLNSETNEPVKGVTVSVKDTELSSQTDDSGNFTINVPNELSTISFSDFAGYSVKEVKIVDSETYNIYLSQSDELFDLSLEQLMDIQVTSVSKKAESVLTAPQTVIVLTEDEILKRGYSDLEQLIHDLPGFDITRSAGDEYAAIYQRGYRSNNTDRTMIMIDGVEQNDLWSQSAWIQRQYPISHIKRVEVVYGPASTVYGANAFLGVINVITKTDADVIKEENKIGVSGTVGGGTWNSKYVDATVSGRYKDVALTVTGRVYQTDNMDFSKYPDYDFDISKYTIEDYKRVLGTTNNDSARLAKQLDSIGYKLNGEYPKFNNYEDNYFFNAKLRFKEFTIDFQQWRSARTYGGWYRDDYEIGNWVPSHTYVTTKYETKVSDKISIANYNTFKVNRIEGESCQDFWFYGYIQPKWGMTMANLAKRDTSYWTESWYATYSQQFRSETKAIIDIFENLNLTSGFELKFSEVQGNYLNGPEKNPEETSYTPVILGGNQFYSRDLGFYTQANYKPFKILSVVAGARIDNNKIRITGGYGTIVNPKFALVLTPSNFIFKAIYSSAFMDASPFAKYSTTDARISNPGLDPEKVTNIEANIGWKITDNLFFDVSAYQAKYSNIVGEVTLPGGKTQMQPIGKLTIQGLQSRLNFKYENYSAFAF
jgi:outer membrane receptor protein involved in Fe transport